MRKGIIGIIALVIILFGGYKAYSYWNTTYHGTTNYAVVPTAVRHKSKTDDGGNYKQNGQQVYYYSYDFTWADEKGNVKHVAWDSAESTNPTPLAQGSYVKAMASAKCVTKGRPNISKDAEPDAEL